MKKMLKILAVLFLTIAAIGVSVYLHGGISIAYINGDTEALEDRVIEIANLYRAQAGLHPLIETAELAQAADIRVAECGVFFSHTRPDGSDWWTVEPDYAWGENLATGYMDADSAVDAWMRSPAHMYNIMSPDFSTCGVGVEMVGGKLYYVAEYGY